MEEKYKIFESKIQLIHKFGFFSNSYIEESKYFIPKKLIPYFAVKTFEKLGWKIIYYDENIAVGERSDGFLATPQTIKVTWDSNLKVECNFDSDPIWDRGFNSKRVKLYIFAFYEITKEYNSSQLNEIALKIEEEKINSQYKIPTELPKITNKPKASSLILFSTLVFFNVILSFILTILSLNKIYTPLLYEFILVIIIFFGLKLIAKVSKFKDVKYWSWIYSIFWTILLSNLLLFEHVILENELTFYDYLNSNLIYFISRLLQFSILFYISYSTFILNINILILEDYPKEVLEFVNYLNSINYTKNQISSELSKRGCSKENINILLNDLKYFEDGYQVDVTK